MVRLIRHRKSAMYHGHCAALFAATLFLGCGGAAAHPTARLAGEVTIDSVPVEEGSISFLPAAGGEAVTVIITAGQYEAPAVPRGKVKAMISATKATGKMITDYSEPYPERINIVPARYAPGFELDVAGDKLDQHFHMTN
jgi:hypothetical protein